MDAFGVVAAVILGILFGVALGFTVGWVVAKTRFAGSNATAIDLAAAEATITQLTERLADAQRSTEMLKEQYAHERAQREETEEEKQLLLQKFAPVDRVITDLKTKVEQMEAVRTQQHAEIQESIRNSVELTNGLSQSTQSLSRLLAGGAQRGRWGEVQLERVAELAGLRKNVDYVLQHTLQTEDGAFRPDMVVNLPGGTQIAVDAKVPFDSYEKALAVNETDPNAAEQRKQYLSQHAAALKSHIKTLASKDYAKSMKSKADFTVCFVPAESVLSAALEVEPGLTEYAIEQKVILASPLSLVAVLRPVAITWAQVENVERAADIVAMGQDLYSRLITLAGHAVSLGSAIKSSVSKYNDFVGSLELKTLSKARQFSTLAPKDLPVVEVIHDGEIREFATAELRGLNAALEPGQTPIGEPIDAEVVDEAPKRGKKTGD